MAAAAVGVEAGEETVEVGGALGRGEVAEAFAVARVLGRGGEEAIDERAQVEAGAAGDDGQVAAFGDAGEGFAGLTAVVARGAGLVWPCDIDHVVLDEGAVFAARAWRCRSPSRGRRRRSRN